ncbi:MAG TPA: hypothetical protein VIK78_21025 [Ruminiclostridium sp.]
MGGKVRIIDQTINEALRLGAKSGNIKLMLPLLKKYHVEAVDVYLKYWRNSCYAFEQADLLGLVRCVVNASCEEMALVKKSGFSKVVIIWSHNTRNLSLVQLSLALAEAKTFAKEVYLCIENASDLEKSDIELYWKILTEYGVKRLIYKDRGSNMDCFKAFETLNELKRASPCPLEFIGSNGLGLATSNSLAAFRADIKYIGTAVGGVGIRGNAAMEEVLMALKHLWKQEKVPSGHSLAFDCSEILSYMGIKLSVDKAIVGNNIFAHESGIHVDGISKNPYLYEAIKPEEVGLTRQIIIGKHSGVASIKFKFLQWNLSLSQLEAKEVLEKAKDLAVEQKSALSDCQLKQLYKKQHELIG